MTIINDGGFIERMKQASEPVPIPDYSSNQKKLTKEEKDMMQILDQLQSKVDELEELISVQRNNLIYGKGNLEVVEGDLF